MHEPGLDAAWSVLGLTADADRDQVTRAYRRLARATHPDVSPNPEAAARFATLANAYRLALEETRAGGCGRAETGPTGPRARVEVRADVVAATAQQRLVADTVPMTSGSLLRGLATGDRSQRSDTPIVAGPVHVHPPSDPSLLGRARPGAWWAPEWYVWSPRGTWLGGGW